MDRSRKADLEFLDQRSKGNLTLSERQDIAETRNKLKAQAKDKTLVELRRQLVNANRYGKAADVRVLNERIRAHERSS